MKMIVQARLHLVKVNDHTNELFKNLQQFYEFEFSPYTGYEIQKNGLYDQNEPMQHWSSKGVNIYLLFYDDVPVGFAVVNLSGMLDGDVNTRDIAEFFIMPSFRDQGVGEWMAHKIFNVYKGRWEVRQLPGLRKARAFWNKIIKSYTNGKYEEQVMHDEVWEGTVQRFRSR